LTPSQQIENMQQTPQKVSKPLPSPLERSSIKEPLENQRTVKELETLFPNYKVQNELGDGKYGKVYRVYDKNKDQYVVVKCVELLQNISKQLTIEQKLKFGRSLFFVEVEMHKRFSNLDLSPKLLGYRFSASRGYIVMEFVEGTLGSLLKSNLVEMEESEMDEIINLIEELLQELCTSQVEHGDLHLENIGYVHETNEEGETKKVLKLLDFGNSCCPKNVISCDSALECYQLFRGFCIKYKDIFAANLTTNTTDSIKLNHQFRLLMKKFLQMNVSGMTVEELLLKIEDERKVAETVIYFINDNMYGLMQTMLKQISDQSQLLLNVYNQKRRAEIGANVDNYNLFSQYPPPKL
jgi:serine/threonine protein kinase